MDRLPFATEGVLSKVADMYPASHEGVFYKQFYMRNPLCVSAAARSVVDQGGALVYGRALPCNLTSGGRCPYHGPAFGTGELQEGGATL